MPMPIPMKGGTTHEAGKTFIMNILHPSRLPAFLFLACEDASYMSGQVLHPNGGTVVNG